MTELEILRQLKRKYKAEMVSALIGAGFTRNAYAKAQTWWGLLRGIVEYAYKDELEDMYREYAHRRFSIELKPFDEMKDSFIDRIIGRDGYLDVVSRYIEKKGFREAIDYYIETHNPYFYKRGDGSYGVKGDDQTTLTAMDFAVHQKFLQGKWQYVFTTNFDNALEFVNSEFDMGFQTIYSDYQMSRRKMSRPIVKIHGSLVPQDKTLAEDFQFDGDHSRRYIISREDFATYFERHEAFSYLLRVAMLSGAYLLLGFSGDDPNFQSWLEWVKDILVKDGGRTVTDAEPAEESPATAIVGEGEDNIKVFLIKTDGDEIPVEQQLYYRNHHIGVIHLGNPQVMLELKCFSKTPVSRRINHLLDYLMDGNDDTEVGMDAADTKTESPAKLWRQVLQRLEDGQPVDDVVMQMRGRRVEERFVTTTGLQEYVFDKLLAKKEALTPAEKEVVLYVAEDTGAFHAQCGTRIDTQMQDVQAWQQRQLHEQTLGGDGAQVEDGTDMASRENVLRSLYHLDFSRAKNLLAEWQPSGRYQTVKASLNYFFDREGALRLLDSAVMNASSAMDEFVASFFYNCLDAGFSPHYPLNKFRNQGLVGLSDELKAIVEQAHARQEKIAAYGHEVTEMRMDSYDAEAARMLGLSQRFIQRVSDEGFNLCYGITNMVKATDWYQLFRHIYVRLPYPCLFYSCQYNNQKVLQRIGQDFAFEYQLRDTLPHLLHCILEALRSPDTPGVVLPGMTQLGSQLFFGMKEDAWFDDFADYLNGTFVPEEGRFLYSRDAMRFVGSAMVCLYDSGHISVALTAMLNYFDKQSDEAISLLGNHLRLGQLTVLDEGQKARLEQIAHDAPLGQAATLLQILNESQLLDEELRTRFVKAAAVQGEALHKLNRYGLYNLCHLAQADKDCVAVLKTEILERNIWDCGYHDGGFSETNELFLMHLGDAFVWTDDEVAKIYDNLKHNLSLLAKSKHWSHPFFAEQHRALLTEMQQFVERYPQVAEDSVKQELRTMLIHVRNYDGIEDGLYSDKPDVVEAACSQLNSLFRKGLFEENASHFETLLSKATLCSKPGVTECLVSIAVAVHFCGELVGGHANYEVRLHRLLQQYKGHDLRDFDLRVIHAGHALQEIARYLKEHGTHAAGADTSDDTLSWWIDNENLNRMTFMAF